MVILGLVLTSQFQTDQATQNQISVQPEFTLPHRNIIHYVLLGLERR